MAMSIQGPPPHPPTTLPARSRQANVAVVVECGKMFIRLGQSSFDEELHECSFVFDRALVLSLAEYYKSSMGVSEWWPVYRKVAALVVDCAAVDTVLQAQAENKLGDVMVQLSHLVECSELGQKMFGSSLPDLALARLSGVVEAFCEQMRPKRITQAEIDSVTKKALEKGEEVGADKHLLQKRTVTIHYRQMAVDIHVYNWAEEVHLRVAAWLKSQAVASACLEEMSWEKGMFEMGMKLTFDPAALVEFKSSRQLLAKMLADVPEEGALIVEIMSSKSQAWEST